MISIRKRPLATHNAHCYKDAFPFLICLYILKARKKNNLNFALTVMEEGSILVLLFI